MRYLTLAIILLLILAIAGRRLFPSGNHKAATVTVERHMVTSDLAARRVLSLSALVQRANAEYHLHPVPGDVPFAGNERASVFEGRTNEWLSAQGLWSSLSNEEKRLLQKPLGTWTDDEIADSQWREETMATLLWALQSDEPMPKYDQPAFFTELIKSLPVPGEAANFLKTARLRGNAELLQARDMAELWLWRARTTQLEQREGPTVKGYSLGNVVAMAAKKAGEDGLFAPIRNDFPALGKAYYELSQDEWQTMYSIATERLYALNWLCGYAQNWDEVPTDT